MRNKMRKPLEDTYDCVTSLLPLWMPFPFPFSITPPPPLPNTANMKVIMYDCKNIKKNPVYSYIVNVKSMHCYLFRINVLNFYFPF